MSKTLVIVPCGARKIWDETLAAGPTAAREAYTGAPFNVNRRYAEQLGDEWLVLSAKYGFIRPDFVISGPYNVTFKQPSTDPVQLGVLKAQVRSMRLADFHTVTGLGGKEYRAMIRAAFADLGPTLVFPFEGLPIGKAMSAAKTAADAFRLKAL